MKVYGIKNCNSVKKALDVFNDKAIEFEYFDIKKLDIDTLESWLRVRNFNELINTAGATAKKLELNKEKIMNLSENELKKIVLENPSCIKRPIVEKNIQIYIGKEYEKIL